MKNKSYIGISFIVLVFGIWAVPKIVDKFVAPDLFTLGKAPSFDLVNQHGEPITDGEYDGKVYVVEFFFSTCPTICPIMNKNMKQIQDEFYAQSQFGIVSFTINPEKDTSEVLLEHAKEIGATQRNWNFLTGDKEMIYEIANKGYNLYAGENSDIVGGFEHSGFFALVDKKGMIRCRKDELGNPIGFYDGLSEDGVKMIKEDIQKLLNE